AHQHAANADDYSAQGLLIPAAEEHYKAAEAFDACIEASQDENARRTLRMLYHDHLKAGKEMQRRIVKLREENKDPALPQKPTSHTSSVPVAAAPAAPQPVPSPPPHSRNRMTDSQQTVDESFMLLGHRSDSGDPFNQFWKITEGMLDYLSQPVAFATAPLAPPSASVSHPAGRRRDGNSSSDTDIEDPISRRLSRGIGLMKAARSKMLTRNDSSATASDSDGGRAGPSTFPPKPQPLHAIDLRDDWDEEVRADDVDDDMADSFCLIPSKSDPTVATLKKENAALKSELEEARKQLAAAEGMLKMRQEHDQQLRDSILVAREKAQRAMISSAMIQRPAQGQPPVDLSSLNLNVPPVAPPVAALSPGRDREGQLLRRVRELEDQMRELRSDNEKQQKAMIVRFRERWEKLKESAKRKKEAKAAAEVTSVVGDRIDEDPEAEEEAERDDLRPRKQSDSAAAI
ncbi:hypothetical protein B0H21DRAFT_685234, partial [Amylocystis lapponica]